MEKTHSIHQLIVDIETGKVALPEFQRDFVWEVSKTYDLFDSLAKDIFIGAIIYGVPSFEIAVRPIDDRPRPSKGKKRAALPVRKVTKEEIVEKHRLNKDDFRLVLDGQQRTTSLYRAIKGIDNVWFHAHTDEELPDDAKFEDLTLEQLLYAFEGEQDDSRICIRLSDVWEIDKTDPDEDVIREKYFEKTAFYQANCDFEDFDDKTAFRRFRILRKKITEFLKGEKLLSYYLLDMNLEKFVTFFERSNTRGVQLNFIDILAAKLYTGDFNLKKEIQTFNDKHPHIDLVPEIIVRAMAYMKSSPKAIHRRYILENLVADDFRQWWGPLCQYYKKSIEYLHQNKYIIQQSWMPYDNMLIPMMIFLHEIGGDFHQMAQVHKEFLSFWYWSSVFSLRYSGSSNERIIEDAGTLALIAKDKKITSPAYFNRLAKIQITEPDDIFSFDRKANAVYRGILNLVHYEAGGLPDWQNDDLLSQNSELEDHHIFPKNYLVTVLKADPDSDAVDCVANRTLMPKKLNIKISDDPPSVYLQRVKEKNPNLEANLSQHLIPADLLSGEYDKDFNFFLQYRAEQIFRLVQKYLIEPAEGIRAAFLEEPRADEQTNIPVFGTYKGHKVDATFNPSSQKIFYKGRLIESPSTAAILAKKDCGAPDDTSENGWTWWKFLDDNGQEQRIDTFRRKRH